LIVATPARTHVAVARSAATCGLPALVEKPPAADTDGARALERLDPAPWLGFNRRFEPAVASMVRAIPDAEPLELTLSLSARRGAWDPHAADDDILLDLGPHLIDLTRWLSAAEIERIRARLDGESAELEVDLGSRGQATISCAGDRPWRERFEVRDARGRPRATYAAGGLRAHAARLRRGSRPHPLVVSLARQLEAFAAAARGRTPSALATAADGVATMQAIDAARASAADGGAWVSLDLEGAPC
jgi:predicted dehydrogenase